MSNTTGAPGADTSDPAGSPAPEPSPTSPPANSPSPSPDEPTSSSAEDTPSPTEQPSPTESSSDAEPSPTTPPEESSPAETPTDPAPTTPPVASTTETPDPTPADPTTSEAPASTPEEDPETEEPLSTVITVTPTEGTSQQTSVVVVVGTSTNEDVATLPTATTSGTTTATPIGPSEGGSGGLKQGSKVAIGVVVPIAAIAILALVGLFWWKKRRARQQAEEERRKEVEDYSYNPNADPTIPNVAMTGDGNYEMREDGSSGYRGWGNTTVGSTGRKASTTMSGGVVSGQAYSDATSPTMRGNMSDAPLVDGNHSPEGEILGQMGPSAANNRGGDVHRGPSNASSSYSAAARSEGSDGAGASFGAGGTYYDQYAQNNPYNEQGFNGQQAPSGQPIIRDNPARRNTRIENTSHYPQQSAGISQNF